MPRSIWLQRRGKQLPDWIREYLGQRSAWIDLTPDLKNSPKQVDLLAQASTECFLAMLGSKTEIQAGTYQQIRVFLAPDNTSISPNQCSAAAGSWPKEGLNSMSPCWFNRSD